MKKNNFPVFIILIFVILNICCMERSNPSELRGEYLGMTAPSIEPKIFAPRFISTGLSEFGSVFSHGGDEFYYCISGIPFTTIMVTKMVNDVWTEPRVIEFTGKYWDGDMMFSPNGERLYFCSFRPLSGKGEPERDADIWYVERNGDGWSEPGKLGNQINTDGNEYYPVFAENGNLYFSSTMEGGMGGADIYYCLPEGDGFSSPVNLGAPVNSRNFEGDLFIAPDESFIIVTVYGRSDSYGSGDLYISFKNDAGEWSELKNMGNKINSNRNEHCPVISTDGKYFFYSSGKLQFKNYSESILKYNDLVKIKNSPGNGLEDIYWIDAKIIEELR
ncbi:TolB family protein [candidate division KSB1 bacterium]